MVTHSDSLALVWRIAELEASHQNAAGVEPVHFFLALLKIVDVDLGVLEIEKEKGAEKAGIMRQDVAHVRRAFAEAGIETTPLRRRLRHSLPRGPGHEGSPPACSAGSRAVFQMTGAFAGSGEVKPIHLLSILAEVRVPYATELMEDQRLDCGLLLEASTKLALSESPTDGGSSRPALVARWETVFAGLEAEGWTVCWRRSIVGDALVWNLEAAREGARHVVSAEDLGEALEELGRRRVKRET